MWIKKFKRFSSEQILIGVLALVATSVLALFISLSFFNYPAADDFCFAAKARQLGFFGAQAPDPRCSIRVSYNLGMDT